MSQYIRIQLDFFTHRKTLRLHALVGEAAFWIVPRLWAHAALNQKNGIYKDYSASEIAQSLGYTGDASSMLKAFISSGYMDENPLRIHEWEKHNAYHEVYAARAKKAAEAMWATRPPGEPEPEEPNLKGKERKGASMLEASPLASLFNAWNETADNIRLPRCLILSDKRRRHCESRLRDEYFNANWKLALEKIVASDFCKGRNERGWTATFDWFVQPDVVAKIMEGKYDNRGTPATNVHRPLSLLDMRTILQAKESKAISLKAKYTSEDAFGAHWSDAAKRTEWQGLRKEIKELNDKIANFS